MTTATKKATTTAPAKKSRPAPVAPLDNPATVAHAAAAIVYRRNHTPDAPLSDRAVAALSSLGFIVDGWNKSGPAIKRGTAPTPVGSFAAYVFGRVAGGGNFARSLAGVHIERADGGDPIPFSRLMNAARLGAADRPRV